jgi:DNA-binding NtrC family response regulator
MTTPTPLLLVDDDPIIRETLSFALGRDFAVQAAADRASAIEMVRKAPGTFGVALIDLGLPPLPQTPTEGLKLISDLLAHAPGMRIVVLSGQNHASHARRARALGAFGFVAKPSPPEAVKAALRAALAAPALPTADYALVGESPPLRKLKAQIDLAAASRFSVLVMGESGTGKEKVARALHALSPWADQPFLALNCAAIAPNLVEPTLFGHAKGAFTGAQQNRAGYFEDAGQGTLFLDEIAELPLEAQAKLLRVLEDGEFARVGETASRKSHARIVGATNRDLRAATESGGFRGDLFHRLSVFTLNVPPLRDLADDRLRLFRHFQATLEGQAGGAVTPFNLSPEAEHLLLAYPFPGNVRELRNVVVRLTAKYAGYAVSAAELADELDTQATPSLATNAQPSHAFALELARPGFTLDGALRELERGYIAAAIAQADGNMTHAAKLLGIGRTTLYARLEAARAAAEGGASTPLATPAQNPTPSP